MYGIYDLDDGFIYWTVYVLRIEIVLQLIWPILFLIGTVGGGWEIGALLLLHLSVAENNWLKE